MAAGLFDLPTLCGHGGTLVNTRTATATPKVKQLSEARIDRHFTEELPDGTLTTWHDVLLASASQAPLMHSIRVAEFANGQPTIAEHIATETRLACASDYYRHSCNHPAAALHVVALWHLHEALRHLDMRQVVDGHRASRLLALTEIDVEISQHTEALRVLGFVYRAVAANDEQRS